MADASECVLKTRRCWPRLTPDRFVVVLLILEGFLWLSGRFGWFPFNHHKGWTVLIAVASVAVLLLLAFLWFLLSLVFKWRFQFSLLSLFLLTVVVALPCGWLETEMKAAREQGMREAKIWKAGGDLDWDCKYRGMSLDLPEPDWLWMSLGLTFFVDVRDAGLLDRGVNEETLEAVEGLPQLRGLRLNGPNVGDDELRHIEGLTRLEALFLRRARVGDRGLQHLKKLTHLQYLDLTDTKVGDSGLQCLKGLLELRRIILRGTRVTATGVRDLQRALPNVQVRWNGGPGWSDAIPAQRSQNNP
jgi:hypothetical protein